MNGRKECWVTSAFTSKQCLNALVLAKSLQRVMTSRSLVILVCSSIAEDLWVVLQKEFDVCVRIDDSGFDAELYAKIYCWSMIKWDTVAFLEANCLVVRNCDEIFEKKTFCALSKQELGVFVAQPLIDVWQKLMYLRQNRSVDVFNYFGKMHVLEEKFNVSVNLMHNYTAKNLDEICIVKFTVHQPLEILCQNLEGKVTGFIERAVLDLWQNYLENGVVQLLSQVNCNDLNGKYAAKLKGCTRSINIVSHVNVHIPDPYETPCTTALKCVPSLPSVTQDISNSIAIVGMSCRFPGGANTVDEFWKLLVEGKDAMRHCPQGRWVPERCVNVPDHTKGTIAGFLTCSVDEFDGKFFGMSPMELSFTDPQQRMTLQVAWEALEDAGINPLSLKDTFTGVFGGAWGNDYLDILHQAKAAESDFFRSYIGNSVGVITARISHCLGLTGPSLSTESGCSTSMVAVDMACKSLLRHETNLSLACGVNLLLHPFNAKKMGSIFAPDGHFKSFDESADGFARAEGCGVLVLKRYADAVRDGDRVWALIRGSAVVHEGSSSTMSTPSQKCLALAMKSALKEAKVQPKDVSFVEAHGTGTPVGDPLEVAAMGEVYSEGREEALIIGSVKTNIGHTESCSGIAGVIKTILSMKNELIPRHVSFKKLNPAINLDIIPAQLPLQNVEWKKDPSGKPRIAGVSSFGISGTNVHVIIQETPQLTIPKLSKVLQSSHPHHILTLSGKSLEALENNVSNFKTHLDQTDESLSDIAHTASIGRAHFQFRTAIIGKDKLDIVANMKNAIKRRIPEETPKVCFLFTGQGSQYPGMSKALYDHDPIFKMHFDICDRYLNDNYGIKIKDAIWGNNTHELSRSIYSQTSIFCVEYCLLKLWECWGVLPDYVLGHSLGEFTAAVAAGILSFEDALKLVAERSRLIDGLPRGKMLVIKAAHVTVDTLLKTFIKGSDKWLDYAAVNSKEQTVLAGPEENIREFSKLCESNKMKTHILEATNAFHSRHMDPILHEYQQIASTVTYSNPTCVYVSAMEGQVIEEGGYVNADYWVRHTRESVKFLNASEAILKLGVDLFLEVGPQPILSALILVNADEVPDVGKVMCLPTIKKQDENWSTILNTLGKLYVNGMNIDWMRFYQFSNAKKVTAPFYPFQNKPYWYEIPDQGPGSIHPFVGNSIPNASDLKIYSKNFKLEEFDWLRDHVVGSCILLPGSVFLEMCCVSGYAATHCTQSTYHPPTFSISLENFSIDSPLCINENDGYELQTVVTSEDSGEAKVIIYSKLVLDKETIKWIPHAAGTFSHVTMIDNNIDQSLCDIYEAISNLRKNTEPELLDKEYKAYAEAGLRFGPTFRTLMRRWTGENEICFEVAVPDTPEKYLCHPILLDAFFQSMIIVRGIEPTLTVPISAKKFIWFADTTTDKCYIHHGWNSEGDSIVTLFDNNGNPLAQMSGAILLATTIGNIMSSLEAQKMSLPSIYEDVWRPQLGPLEKRVNLMECFPYTFHSEVCEELQSLNDALTENFRPFIEKSNELYLLYMIKGLYDLGWVPQIGQEYTLTSIQTSLNVIQKWKGLLRYILMELAKEGLFKVTKEDKFQLIRKPQPIDQIVASIEDLYEIVHPMSKVEIEFVSLTGRNLAFFLSGKESALPLLFPNENDINAISADNYYKECYLHKILHQILFKFNEILFQKCSKQLGETKRLIRILEVGAGTGSSTRRFLPSLLTSPSTYEYTYTDLSSYFFEKGEKIFENSGIKVLYRILNLEEDAISQGFIPKHYDIIIAHNVIHATESITRSVRNLRNILRDHGVLFIYESVSLVRSTNLTFGLLDGYWRFKDYDLRPFNCEMSLDNWDQLLKTLNFENISWTHCCGNESAIITARAAPSDKYITFKEIIPTKMDTVWIIFSDKKKTSKYFEEKLRELGNLVVIVTPSNKFNQKDNFSYSIRPEEDDDVGDLFHSITTGECGELQLKIEGVVYLWGLNYTDFDYIPVCKPFLAVCKHLVVWENVKLFVVTSGFADVGDVELSTPFSSPLWGMTRCFQNEKPDAICRCIDLDEIKGDGEEQFNEAFSELFVDDGEIYVAYRDHQRIVSRFYPWKVPNLPLSLPKSERFRLVLHPNNAIRDLRFGPMEKTPLGEGNIEVCVKAYALNFKDVLVVLKPTAEFEKLNSVGLDYAGVVSAVGPNVKRYKVGDAVFALNFSGDSMPSHIVTLEDLVIDMPQSYTFNEAATLPTVAATTYVSLIQVGKLTSNDTILIHTASGGVGLVAIQIAKSIGATIVATAGSRRKRTYLKNLGIKYIFNSRNTNYEKEIRTALNGRGVDVVLNSLTSPGFKEASLGICNENARFIEMSKLNVWTAEEVKFLRPDIKYKIIDISAFNLEQMRNVMAHVGRIVNDSTIQPIPFVRFDVSEIREALTYLQKAKHIGKIVCTMPEEERNSSSKLSIIPMFNERSTYLITGGLGGIGFEVAKWMARSGAVNIALVGRNPPIETISGEILRLNSEGKNLIPLQYDIGDMEQCKKLLDVLKSEKLNLPPLRGIMHAAGVLSDAIFANQTWDKYEMTYNPKVKGGWNLHKLTLDYPLEHFVLFSSVTTSVGMIGQGNHVSANAFLDSLAFYRNGMGLPATTVNWGQWGQVGVAANIEVRGIRPFTPLQGISALEKLMKSQKVAASVCELDFGLVKQICPVTKRYFDELRVKFIEEKHEVVGNEEQFWSKFDTASDSNISKMEIIRRMVQSTIRRLLKLNDELVEDSEDFHNLGMDSLLTIELKNMLQATLGKRAKITMDIIKDCHNINDIIGKLVEVLSPAGSENLIPPVLTE